MSDSLWRHGLQHAGLPCPSPTPGAYSNSCPLSWWCHPIISSSVVPFSSCLQSFPASGSFPMSQFFAKYWSFSISIRPSNEYSGLISFRIDWFDLLAVQGTLKSYLQHHSSKASILCCSAFFIVQLPCWLPCPLRLGWGITSSKKAFLFSFVFPEPFWLYLHGLCLIMFMVITIEAAAAICFFCLFVCFAICFYVPDTRSCLHIHCLI